MALGARRASILRMVVGRGLALTLAGVAIGVPVALLVTRLIAGLLFGVSATDPLTFIAVSTLITAVAAAACCLPAYRATRVDPMVALRVD